MMKSCGDQKSRHGIHPAPPLAIGAIFALILHTAAVAQERAIIVASTNGSNGLPA
jgi:hypothetical protein